MIRFACPGCQATFSVADEKAGKTGKCPKCQAQFVIPGDPPAVRPAAVAPPPAPAAAADTVEVAPCPGCQARLSVSPEDVGSEVECPYCQTVYTAATGGGPAATPRRRPAAEADRPSRRDDDDRPSRRSRRDDEDDDDDRSSRRSRRDDDDEDDRPSRKRSKRRRKRHEVESLRTTAGILALLVGFLGIHKFYLGYTGPGILLIFGNCIGVSGIIAFIEGIIYLTKSDDEFIETYQIGSKEWF